MVFSDPSLEQRFLEFSEFLGDRRSNPEWLEIIASLHFLTKLYPNRNHQQVVDKVRAKQPYFTKDRVIEGLNYLISKQLVESE
jgi:hypothetical protein